MAVAPLTFGVEFEILIAILKPGFPVPNDAYDELTWRFDPTPEQVQEIEREMAGANRRIPTAEQEFRVNQIRSDNARNHIAEALSDASIPAVAGGEGEGGIGNWLVTDDCSLESANDGANADTDPWFWASVEIVSPVLSFTPQGLSQVAKVCDLVRSKYRYKVDELTSMHVHVGDGNKSFPLQVLKNFAAVLWAFEPQFLSLHPIDRMCSTWVIPPRFHSEFTTGFIEKRVGGAIYPHPIQAVHRILARTSIQDLTDMISEKDDQRYMIVNFANVACIDRGVAFGEEKEAKPTLEFRQHHGTLDSEKATMWIKTVAGLVDAVRNLPQVDLEALVNICANEKWAKLGDGKDAEREAEFGPIMAESTFTAVDLFRLLGLNESADYYDGKLYEHDYSMTRRSIRTNVKAWFVEEGIKWPRNCLSRNPFWATWDYETPAALAVNPEGSESYERNHEDRLLWERTMAAYVARRDIDANTPAMNPSDPMWPAHKYSRPVSPPTLSSISSLSDDDNGDDNGDGGGSGDGGGDSDGDGDGSNGSNSDAADQQEEIGSDIENPEEGLNSSSDESFDGYRAPRLPKQNVHRNYTADNAYAYAAYHARREPDWIQNNTRAEWQAANGFTNLRGIKKSGKKSKTKNRVAKGSPKNKKSKKKSKSW